MDCIFLHDLRHSIASVVSLYRRLRRSEIVILAEEKRRSGVADIARMVSISRAILDRFGYNHYWRSSSHHEHVPLPPFIWSCRIRGSWIYRKYLLIWSALLPDCYCFQVLNVLGSCWLVGSRLESLLRSLIRSLVDSLGGRYFFYSCVTMALVFGIHSDS